MQIFITGATGFIGGAVVKELLGAGHRVVGLVRSDKPLPAGATAHRGDLEDLDTLRRGAADADVVIHTAFVHDAANPGSGRTTFQQACDLDAAAIEALGGAMRAGSQLIVTSGTPVVPGRASLETDASPPTFPRRSERAAAPFADRLRVGFVRLPRCVHVAGGPWGFGSVLLGFATRTGVSAYVGDGAQRWCAVNVADAARLYRIVVERQLTGAVHAVGEEGIPQRAIAEAIGARLNVPAVARPPEHFGPFAMFAQLDSPASSAHTQAQLAWTPTGSGLLADLAY